MEAETIIKPPDWNNLVRLANHFMEKVVKQSEAAVSGKEFDKVSLHVSAKKVQEILKQMNPLAP
jgi:hypothetical protein